MMQRRFLSRFCLSQNRHLLSAALDSELDPVDRRAVEKHLQGCIRCTSKMERLRFAKNAIRSLKIPIADYTYPGTANLLRKLPDSGASFNVHETISLTPHRHILKLRPWVATAGIACGAILAALALYSSITRPDKPASFSGELHSDPLNSAANKRVENAPTPVKTRNSSEERSAPLATRPPDRMKSRVKSVIPQEIELPELWEAADVRGSENNNSNSVPQYTIVRFRFKETLLNIDLPENSKKGTYVVELKTMARFESIFPPRSKHSDGQTLLINLPLQVVQPGNYMMLVARKNASGDEYIGQYPVVVADPEPGQDGTK